MKRRLVISVCPREPGVVRLPARRGGRPETMHASGVARRLEALVAERRLAEVVRLESACAGGCASPGPNVTVTIYPARRPGEKPDHVAVGRRTYVDALASLDCLATVIEENLRAPSAAGTRRRRRAR